MGFEGQRSVHQTNQVGNSRGEPRTKLWVGSPFLQGQTPRGVGWVRRVLRVLAGWQWPHPHRQLSGMTTWLLLTAGREDGGTENGGAGRIDGARVSPGMPKRAERSCREGCARKGGTIGHQTNRQARGGFFEAKEAVQGQKRECVCLRLQFAVEAAAAAAAAAAGS
jgi:hypothetical protein